MQHENELYAATAQLCLQAGYAEPFVLHPLAGGRNNRVFRVEFKSRPPLLLKSYSTDTRDPRDRLGAEWAFLDHAWSHDIRTVPQPLARNKKARLALIRFMEGRKLQPGEITQDHIAQAADFILDMNAMKNAIDKFAPASEACFSLADHIQTVDHRIGCLDNIDTTAPLHGEAADFIASQLRPAWIKVRNKLDHGADEKIAPILSPSDFGLHNALINESGQLNFVDFEYSGRDDPAKLACDFFCAPEIAVPIQFWESFTGKLAAGLKIDTGFLQRCSVLLDAYRIKWTCIILNDFLAVDEARRRFANAEDRAQRCEQQLEKARTKLAEIGLR